MHFQDYHGLIGRLVGATDDERIKLDVQVATAFELRNYPEYKEVTLRILQGLKQIWNDPKNGRLLHEIDLTIVALGG